MGSVINNASSNHHKHVIGVGCSGRLSCFLIAISKRKYKQSTVINGDTIKSIQNNEDNVVIISK